MMLNFLKSKNIKKDNLNKPYIEIKPNDYIKYI